MTCLSSLSRRLGVEAHISLISTLGWLRELADDFRKDGGGVVVWAADFDYTLAAFLR